MLTKAEKEILKEIVRHSDLNGNGYKATRMKYYAYMKDDKAEREFRRSHENVCRYVESLDG